MSATGPCEVSTSMYLLVFAAVQAAILMLYDDMFLRAANQKNRAKCWLLTLQCRNISFHRIGSLLAGLTDCSEVQRALALASGTGSGSSARASQARHKELDFSLSSTSSLRKSGQSLIIQPLLCHFTEFLPSFLPAFLSFGPGSSYSKNTNKMDS